MSELLIIQDLNFSYDDHVVLQNLNLSIDVDMPTLLCGDNGVGKTTILNILSGVISLPENHGKFFWSGKEVQLNEIQARVAYIQSPPALFAGLSGHENIRLCAMLFNECQRYRQAVRRMCRWFGLTRLDLDKDVAKYSQGMLQKLWISINLSQKKDLYLLDEPFNGLDSTSISKLCELILSSPKTFLIVAHEPPQIVIDHCRKFFVIPAEKN